MTVFICLSVLIALIFGIAGSNTEAVSDALLSSPQSAVELTIKLLGAMAFWGGVMKVAEKSGMVNKLSKLSAPLLKRLFHGIDENGEAFGAIVMNITANLMGLGNAATPLGLKAITALAKEEKAKESATRNMITLVVLNTASIQLLPTTVATLRQAHGSENPMEILPPVLFTSAVALAVGLSLVFLLDKSDKGSDRIK